MRSKFKWIFTLLVAFTMQFSFAQQKTVTGVVSDDLGPVAGANVVVKGTTTGTTTDFDGNYSISAKQGDVLVISYAGSTQSVTVGAGSTYNVTLKAVELDETVVTGALGIKKTANEVTNAFTVVSSEEMNTAQNPNAVRSLAGKVAGLRIDNLSNGVNGSTGIQLRSPVTFTRSTEALIVIDGVPSTNAVFQSLPPSMIESVNVIKGAQGAALYGSQGADGVIVVTTIKAKKGKVSVNFNSAIDFEDISFVPERQNSYGQGWNGAWDQYENGGWGEPFDGSIRPVGLAQTDGTYIESAYSPIKDHVNQFYKVGTIMQNGFNVRLGGDNSFISFAADNLQRDFIVEGDQSKRTNALLRAGVNGQKWSLEGTFNYRVQKVKQSDSETTLLELSQSASNIPIGQFDNGNGLGGWTVYYNNPFWRRDNNRFNNDTNYFNTALTAAYKINNNIELKYNGGIQVTGTEQISTRNELVEDPNHPDASHFQGSLSQTSAFYKSVSSNRYYYGDLLASFNYELTSNLGLKALIGHNMQKTDFYRVSQGGVNLDIPGWYHINNVLNPDIASSLRNSTSQMHKTAEFASVDLAFKKYLFLNLTGRYEHSSLLPAEARDFFYPSAGLSFVASEYKDLNDYKVNYLKFYTNYTKVGSVDSVLYGDIIDRASLASGFAYPGGSNSYNNQYFEVDPKIKPEYYNTMEAGFSLGMFNNRITLDAAAYITDTNGFISDVATSSFTGIQNKKSNVGDLQTKGLEIALGLVPVKTENFKWNTNFVFSTYTNEVKSTYGGGSITLYDVSDSPNSNITGQIQAIPGESFPHLTGTDWIRDDQGRVIINDATGNPSIDPVSKKLGKVLPDYTLGINNSLTYKGVTLSFLVDYRKGGKLFTEAKYNMTWSGHAVDTDYDRDNGFIFPNSVLASTGEPNTTVATGAGYGSNGAIAYANQLAGVGSYNVIDGTFVKVRELALSYSLPAKFTEKLGITSLRFGVNARNPFIFLADSNKGYTDPEASNVFDISNANAARTAGGLNTNSAARGFSQVAQYPSTKTFGFSLNVGF